MANLGRFQRGDFVLLSVAPVDGSDNPVVPNEAPTATVTGGNVSATYKLPLAPLRFFPEDRFAWGIFLGHDFSLDTYSVAYSYTYGSGPSTGSATDTFDVIAGGDEGGPVIAMAYYQRPEASYVVGQLVSGKLVQGRNPRL